MIDKKFIYSGPSWAHQSFDTPQGLEPNKTSLLKQWGLENIAVNISQRGSNANAEYSKFTGQTQVFRPEINGTFDLSLPIIYVMCEPLGIFNDNPSYLNEYIDNSRALWDMRYLKNKQFMRKLSRLNNRVAVIGAHADVSDVPDNVTIIDSSWQNFLRQEAGLDTGYNWGSEVLHRHMTDNDCLEDMLTGSYKNKESVEFIVDKIWNQFDIWKKLEKNKLFCDVHPNKLGNELYAKHTLDNVQEFLGL